jgi:hypothetical protein
MRITVTLDDELFNRALEQAGPNADPAEVLSDAVRTCVRVLAAKRLAARGGMAGAMVDVARRAEPGSATPRRTHATPWPGEGAG